MPRRYTKGKSRSMASAMRKIAKSVVAKNTETKVWTGTFSDTPVGAGTVAPVVQSCNDIAEGTAQNQRIGNQIMLTSIKYDFFFTGADSTNSLRLIFYIPRDPNDILLNLGFNAPADLDKYVILKDIFMTTNQNGQDCLRKRGYISFRKRGKSNGLKVQYSTNAVNSQTKNRVLVYMVSDSGVISHPSVNGFFRTFYKDC